MLKINPFQKVCRKVGSKIFRFGSCEVYFSHGLKYYTASSQSVFSFFYRVFGTQTFYAASQNTLGLSSNNILASIARKTSCVKNAGELETFLKEIEMLICMPKDILSALNKVIPRNCS